MSSPLIPTKLPYVDDQNSVEDVVNYMVKTINSTTTKRIAQSIQQSFSDSFPVGSIIHSMLTESQFQSQLNAGWVLMDGRNVAGSSYSSITGSSTIPDATGRFLRGKGANNPDGDLALGTRTAYKTAITKGQGFGSATDPYIAGTPTGPTASTANETAPDNITVNIFIKIN